MACFHPLMAYARRDLDGKREIVFASDHKQPWIDRNGHLYSEKLELPCGQCVACRLEYSRQWAIRCLLEAKSHPPDQCWFLTLTYNDAHLPVNYVEYVDTETGEYIEEFNGTLVKRDLQLFMKRLRIRAEREFGVRGIRFYCGGEYGDKTQRPHYHMILFGFNIPDLVLYTSNFRGDCYYTSAFLEDVWGNGFVVVGDLCFDTAAYVARYIMKKKKGKNADYYEKKNIVPEFSVMSRRPGIASAYFDSNAKEIYKFDQIVITGADGKAKRVKPPAYYDRLYDVMCPEDLQRIKDERSAFAKHASKEVMKRTSLDRVSYLKVKENNKLLSISALKRTLD